MWRQTKCGSGLVRLHVQCSRGGGQGWTHSKAATVRPAQALRQEVRGHGTSKEWLSPGLRKVAGRHCLLRALELARVRHWRGQVGDSARPGWVEEGSTLHSEGG